MKPTMQTMFFDKDGTGNCFEACIASILEMELSEVPMFHGENWFSKFYDWLISKGFEYNGTINPSDIFNYKIGIDGYFIVAGESPRGNHIRGGHAVIYKSGKLVHDPHPDNTGIVDIKYGMAIEPISEAASCGQGSAMQDTAEQNGHIAQQINGGAKPTC